MRLLTAQFHAMTMNGNKRWAEMNSAKTHKKPMQADGYHVQVCACHVLHTWMEKTIILLPKTSKGIGGTRDLYI